MLIIHGPTYQYRGESLSHPELIYVRDHHYDGINQCFHLQALLQGSQEHTVVFDHVLQHDEFLDNPVYFPALLAREADEFNQHAIQVDWQNKTHAFNFIINKPRPHRLLLLELIDQYKLFNYCHSLCWQSAVGTVPVTDFRIGDEIVLDQGFRNRHYPNATTYQQLLQAQVFEPTAVSLITEPAYYERETIITEKTLMAIYGGTVPVWVGGWRIADYMRDQGFDVFDDLVDHSYQSLADPAERVQQAVRRNQHLLTQLVTVDPARLQHNLELAQSNPWLVQVNNYLEIYPDLRKVWPA